MNTHERLLSVAQRLDELAGELDNDELTTLSNELAEIADVGGAEKIKMSPRGEPPRSQFERTLNELIEREMTERILREPDIVEKIRYSQRYRDLEYRAAQMYVPTISPRDIVKGLVP